MVLMGSTAIKRHFPDFPREPKDWDFIDDVESDKVYGKLELLPLPALYKTGDHILTPDQIYTVKLSHIAWNINWEKHMFDIQFLKSKGCKVDMVLLKELYAYWGKVHGENKRANLNMSKEDFFDNALQNQDIHDLMHTLIKNPPTYTKVLVDPNGVDIDQEKAFALPFEEQLDMVREECYVMAYERRAGRDFRAAYAWQLKQMVLHHTPTIEGVVFIAENYKLLHKPLINYVEVIENGLRQNSSKA